MAKKALLATVVSLVFVASAVYAQVTWPTFQANANHDGYIPVEFAITSYELLWETELSTEGLGLNPVVATNGIVFASLDARFVDVPDMFFALDAGDGSVMWTKGYGSVFSVNDPACTETKTYIQVGKGTGGSGCDLYEYDAVTGDQLSRGRIGCQWEEYYAPTVYDGVVYINGGTYGGMYAFDFRISTTELWFLGLNQYDDWTPAVDEDYAYAYTGENTPRISIVDKVTGVELWSIPDPNFNWNGWTMSLAPVLGGRDDLLAIHNNRLISFDLANLNIRYEILDHFQGQVSVVGGVIYVNNLGTLEARNQETGELLWWWQAPGNNLLSGPMIVTPRHVIASSEWNVTYAIHRRSHEAVWSYPAGGHLAWSNGVLFVARDDGHLTALAASPFFRDGFESGDTSAWSSVAP